MNMSIYINGRKSADGRPGVDILNPANGEKVDSVFRAADGDEADILPIANKGFDVWSNIPLSERSEILYRYADLLDENRDRLATLECKEMGKVISETTVEMTTAAIVTRGFVERAKHLYGNVFGDNQPGLEHDLLFTRREPLGVCLCIVPFNYPGELYTHKVIPALIMGNSVIIKAPEKNPLLMIEMTKLLIEAGVPESAATVLYASRTFTTDKIIKSAGIQLVSLTGSTQAGIDIMRDSAEHLHRVLLELGGNDCLILFDDADLDEGVDAVLGGRIWNTGQTCCASKRFLVHEDVKDEFIRRLIVRLDAVKKGDPMDPATEIGCLICEDSAQKALSQIGHTVAQGAKVIYGGNIKGAAFLQPTILDGVTKDMDVAKDLEIFGPVIPIITFKTDEEAIEIVNQSSFGLQGGIVTKNTMRAIKVASKMKVGSVVLNGSGNYRHMDQPFGGYKMTGIGREGVASTLEEYSQEKTYILKNSI
jgi:succinate-semialdehyde dehydrogenase/glutarate-semialdehyde dehydrogenase